MISPGVRGRNIPVPDNILVRMSGGIMRDICREILEEIPKGIRSNFLGEICVGISA